MLLALIQSGRLHAQGALTTGLWDYDIAHANQRDGAMWPHNFNIVYRWSPSTSNLLRDWFLLQVPRNRNNGDAASNGRIPVVIFVTVIS